MATGSDDWLVPLVSDEDLLQVERLLHTAIDQTADEADEGGNAADDQLDQQLVATVMDRVRASAKLVREESLEAVMVPRVWVGPTDQERGQVEQLEAQVREMEQNLAQRRTHAKDMVEKLVQGMFIGGDNWMEEAAKDCKMVAGAGDDVQQSPGAPTKHQLQTAVENYVTALSGFSDVAEKMGRWKTRAEEVNNVLRELAPNIQRHTDRVVNDDVSSMIATRLRRPSVT